MPKRGGSKCRKKQSIQDLIAQRSTTADRLFMSEVSTASDRAAALLLGAVIDNSLRDVLKEHFRNDWDDIDTLFTGPTACLHSLSSRIRIAFALELFDREIFKSLEAIREIRNAFAHAEIHLSFAHPTIAEKCAGLFVRPDAPHADSTSDPRLRFTMSVFSISIALSSKKQQRALAQALKEWKPHDESNK